MKSLKPERVRSMGQRSPCSDLLGACMYTDSILLMGADLEGKHNLSPNQIICYTYTTIIIVTELIYALQQVAEVTLSFIVEDYFANRVSVFSQLLTVLSQCGGV